MGNSKKKVLFSLIFSLFEAISTHILIGGSAIVEELVQAERNGIMSFYERNVR